MLRLAVAPVALVSLVTPALLLAPATAASGPTCTSGHCIVTFDYTGSPEYFTVPSGVTLVSATVSGASGGRGDSALPIVFSPGGRGGTVTATVPVAAGDQLRIVVGQNGHMGNYAQGGSLSPGGYGGGGEGVYDGGGGGGSYLSRGSSLLVVAGGGGGGGSATPGNVPAPGGAGGAGTNGQAGSPASLGGGGGTTAGPGAPADCVGQPTPVGTGPAAPPSTFGVGGSGDNGCGTDGGGGGYYGGSSGGADNAGNVDGGAGGGSGFLAPGITGVAGTPKLGDGAVTLAYDLPKTATATTLHVAPSSVPAGSATTLTAAVTSATGAPTGTVTFVDKTHNVTLGTGTLANGTATLVLPAGNTAGTRSVVATYNGSGIYGASTSPTATLTVTSIPNGPSPTPTPTTTPTAMPTPRSTPTSRSTPSPTSATTTANDAPSVSVAAVATPVADRARFTG